MKNASFVKVAVIATAGLLASLVAGFRAGAGVMPSEAPPNGIAVIDLENLFTKLDEKAIREAELKKMGEARQAELDKLSKQLAEGEEAIKIMKDGDEKKAKFEEWRKLRFKAEFERQFADAEINERKAEIFRDLFAKIEEGVAAHAKLCGYTMVISSDQNVQIPRGAVDDVIRTISLKRFIYVDGNHDITDDVAKALNNEFNAPPATGTKGKGAPK